MRNYVLSCDSTLCERPIRYLLDRDCFLAIPYQSVSSSLSELKKVGWRYSKGFWFCPYCSVKRGLADSSILSYLPGNRLFCPPVIKRFNDLDFEFSSGPDEK